MFKRLQSRLDKRLDALHSKIIVDEKIMVNGKEITDEVKKKEVREYFDRMSRDMDNQLNIMFSRFEQSVDNFFKSL